MMTTLETIYLQIFRAIYPHIHTHFVSYCLIGVLSLFFAWFNWRCIIHFHRHGDTLATFTKYILIFFEFFLIGFILWFIFIHFHTFLLKVN